MPKSIAGSLQSDRRSSQPGQRVTTVKLPRSTLELVCEQHGVTNLIKKRVNPPLQLLVWFLGGCCSDERCCFSSLRLCVGLSVSFLLSFWRAALKRSHCEEAGPGRLETASAFLIILCNVTQNGLLQRELMDNKNPQKPNSTVRVEGHVRRFYNVGQGHPFDYSYTKRARHFSSFSHAN